MIRLDFYQEFFIYFFSPLNTLWEKGRIRIRTCDLRIQMQIREAIKHKDPMDPDPEHFSLTIKLKSMESFSFNIIRKHVENKIDSQSVGFEPTLPEGI